jgi:hypothetical protein
MDSMPPTWTIATSFSGTRAEMAQRQARPDVDRSTEARDAQGPALQLLCLFDFRPSDQLLHERFQRRTNDDDIGAAEGCARGGTARDLQELHFAGDQSVHAFNAGGCGNHFHVQAMFVEDASFARDPGRTHR